MVIGVHVGMSGDGDDIVSALLSGANEHLLAAGWTAPSTLPPGDPLIDIDEIFAGWLAWAESLRPDVGRAAFSDPRLTMGFHVRGEIRGFVDALRSYGSLIGVGLTRRLDDHIAASFVRKLRDGRTDPWRDSELKATGKVFNYFPRLMKWSSAMGDDFNVLFCPAEARPEPVLEKVATTLGLPNPPPIGDAAVRSVCPRLDADGAEAMRRINQKLARLDASDGERREIREAAFRRLATDSDASRALSLPREAARGILMRYRASAEQLATTMSSDDAEAFLSTDLPEDVTVDSQHAGHLVEAVLSDLGVDRARIRPASVVKSPRAQLKGVVAEARSALSDGDDATYRRYLAEIQQILPQLPNFSVQFREDGDGRIPNRLVQYWDPWPPPEELLPWFRSWQEVGMRNGSHRVFTRDGALQVMEEAAGRTGVKAFEMAQHAASRSDLFRYAELFLRGGWYVDAEHEAFLPIADIHPWPVDHVLLLRPAENRVPNGYLGAVAGSSLMKQALETACDNVLAGRGHTIIEITGPDMLTPLVLEYLTSRNSSYVVLPAMSVFNIFQQVHNEAAYKAGAHWRDEELSTD